MAIIKSLLDTDLYKFTMLQVVLHKFPQTHSVYAFRCRNLEDTAYPLSTLLDEVNSELDALCELRFTADELQYLRGLRFIKSDFVDYLELFQLKRRFIKATLDAEGRLDIRIEGSMIQAMMFEIYVLAIVNDMGQTPLNIVLQLVACDGQSVAKISDSPGKTMTDNDTFLAYLRQVFDITE